MSLLSNIKKSLNVKIDSETDRFSFENEKTGSDNKEKESAAANSSTFSHYEMRVSERAVNHTLNKSRDIINLSNEEAQRIINKAKEQGYSQGYEEGFKKGSEDAIHSEFENKQPVIQNISAYGQKISEYYSNKSADIGSLEKVFELAEKIISIEIAKNGEAIYNLYNKAALHIGRAESATLKLGPHGCEYAKENSQRFKSAIDGLQKLDIVLTGEDDGFCVLETPVGNVDASVKVQMKRAKDIISPES